MPSKSIAQQKFMGMVHGLKKGDIKPSDVSQDVKDAAKSMSKKDAKDYASTKHKGLPKKVKQEILNRLKKEYAFYHVQTRAKKRDHDDDNNLGRKKKHSGQPEFNESGQKLSKKNYDDYKKDNMNEVGVFPIKNYIKGIIPKGMWDTTTDQKKEKLKTIVKDLVNTLNHYWKSHKIPYRVRDYRKSDYGKGIGK